MTTATPRPRNFFLSDEEIKQRLNAHDALLAALRALVEADHRTQPDPLGQTVPHDRLIALWDAEHKARALLRDLSPKEEGQ